MSKFNFTSKSIEALKANGRRTDHYDKSFRIRGVTFGVRLNLTGSKEYFVRYRDRFGKMRRMSIGDPKLKSLTDAHARATEIATALSNGENPAEELHQYKTAETVQELADLYLNQHAKFKKDGGAEDKRMLTKDVLPYLGSAKACDVRRKDIIALLDKVAVEREAKVAANRLRALLSKVFNFALERELIEASPCAGLPRKARETAKERFLSLEEIAAVWNYLEKEPVANASVLKVILLTAQRPMEVAGMRWEEVKASVWELPSDKTKNARADKIPVSPMFKAELEKLLAVRKGAYVFPGERGEHLKARTIQHVCERAIVSTHAI